MIVVGVDENGLGPLLGPMVVTACAFRTPSADPEYLWRLRTPDLPADDSKVVFARNRLARGETATLRWLSLFGVRPAHYAALASALCAPPLVPLPCAGAGHASCMPAPDVSLPLWADPQTAALPDDTARAVARNLNDLGVVPLALRLHALCPGEFNAVLAPGDINKFRLDLSLMVGLVLHIASRESGAPVLAICGKVGGMKSYLPWLSACATGDWEVLQEHPQESAYRLDHRVTFRFIKDGDAAHLPVAVASMVGKYFRELAMHQLNRTWRPEGRPVSGYRDRLTAAFVDETAPQRARAQFPDACFLRRR